MFGMTRWVLGWGDAAEVVRPANLRAEVPAALGRARTVYGRVTRKMRRLAG
jgi:predicted DNA-binding transcriptional regulator YafY